MTKSDLLKLLENVNDNDELNFVSSSYDADDDFTWGPDNETEVSTVDIKSGHVLIVLDTSEFD